MRTLIVDDHPRFSEGLRLLMLGVSQIDDIVACEDGEEALRLAREDPFDLVLLEWNLGGALSGAPLVERMKAAQPEARVIVVSTENCGRQVRLAIASGAVGFVPKDSSPALFFDALSVTAHGGVYLPRAVLADTPAPPTARPAPSSGHGPDSAHHDALQSIADTLPQLTRRQIAILARLGRGLSNKQIARELEIADGTVKQHLNTIFREIGVQSRTEAVYLMVKGGVRFE